MNGNKALGFVGKVLRNPIRALAPEWISESNLYQKPLDGHGRSYLNELITEYKTLTAVEDNKGAQAVIATVLAKAEDNKASWDDVMSFELALVKLLPRDKLVQKTRYVRAEYEEIATDEEWKEYQNSKPPDLDSDQTPVDKIRADVEQLLQELQWMYITLPAQESQRTELMWNVIIYGAAYTIPGLLSLFASAVVGAVFIFGVIGGLISACQRVQKLRLTANEEVNLAKLESFGMSAYFAPLIGGGAALLFALLFMSELVRGPLFPKVSLEAVACPTNGIIRAISTKPAGTNSASRPTTEPLAVSNVIDEANTSRGMDASAVTNGSQMQTNPPSPTGAARDCEFIRHCMCVQGGNDWAMLLVWAFIAGFSERLVPDIINRLASRAEEK